MPDLVGLPKIEIENDEITSVSEAHERLREGQEIIRKKLEAADLLKAKRRPKGRHLPMTQKQRWFIRYATGTFPPKSTTRGQASDLITKLKQEGKAKYFAYR